MRLLAYCYGPFSLEKNIFCKNFISENKNFKLIELHKIRKKITGSIIPKDRELELQVKQEIENKCLPLLAKGVPILVNGLFLNKEARVSFLESIQKKSKNAFKKIALAFPVPSPVAAFEESKKDKILKELSFDSIRSQVSIFNKALTSEEADLLIDEIKTDSNLLEISTKLWGEDRTISCDNFKKLAEYFRCSSSFI
jgi:hypothetical protein